MIERGAGWAWCCVPGSETLILRLRLPRQTPLRMTKTGLGSRYPTLATKTKTSRGWGTQVGHLKMRLAITSRGTQDDNSKYLRIPENSYGTEGHASEDGGGVG